MSDEMRTIEEAYTSAATSSNLRVEADRRSDADILIAAGWAPGILGGALMRLHSEFDSTARKVVTKTDAMLLFTQLKSLPRVLQMIADWAEGRGMDMPRTLSQAVTAYWLDSTCHHCHGRGNEVIPGTPVLGKQCRICGGTGRSREPHGQAGRAALSMIDECVQVARTSIRRRLYDTRG